MSFNKASLTQKSYAQQYRGIAVITVFAIALLGAFFARVFYRDFPHSRNLAIFAHRSARESAF